MSDVGIVFPAGFLVVLALVLALPVTTAIMTGIGISAYRIHRRDPARRLTALKWSAVAVAPFWLAGLLFGGLWCISEIERAIYGAQHYFKLDKAAEIDGVSLPAGTQVTLGENGALEVAELPEGATVTRDTVSWRGQIEFVEPGNAPGGARGVISTGTLSAPATLQGISCQAGPEVHFFWDGSLMYCTLSADTTIDAAIRAADGAVTIQHFRCRAANPIHLQGIRPGQLESCVLAEPAQISQTICADKAELQISNGFLQTCTLAKPLRFGPLDLPPGSKVTDYDGAPSSLALPQAGDAVDGFGLLLPPGTEAFFCAEAMALRQLNVERSRYVAVAGVKLTGDIEFDCGKFDNGQLFEDAIIAGKQRRAGDLITRADLFP